MFSGKPLASRQDWWHTNLINKSKSLLLYLEEKSKNPMTLKNMCFSNNQGLDHSPGHLQTSFGIP